MNNVRVRTNTPPRIRRADLIARRAWFTWYAAWVLFALGWAGTVVAGNGGWGNVLSGKFSLAGTIIALLVQSGLTYSQWCFPDHKVMVYVSRFIDAGITAWGYYSLVGVHLQSLVRSFGVDISTSLYVSIGIVYLVSFIPAWYPEKRLVGDV